LLIFPFYLLLFTSLRGAIRVGADFRFEIGIAPCSSAVLLLALKVKLPAGQNGGLTGYWENNCKDI
jgi:hypothetical protein